MIDYNSKRWERKREHILKRDGYMCQESKRYGKRIDADMVHHIWPADEYPEYAWEDWNLISLANRVHNKMHHRLTKKLTPQGEALRKRTPPPKDKNN
ncbi:HNH endonuclease [Ruminiclostridium papyrosolvens]|uniref:HNH endonuclease n=1 Tax=Ruminiclostridium papyrosolvens C7 TaxID=1330534 RepID=U4QWM3_9FIRM|nr:HNH endonuclease [Ruminiclostridium papyrosolvens]EPR07663.1 HNH endonuclease [Ruminiclostridium papyrosolvens C7]